MNIEEFKKYKIYKNGNVVNTKTGRILKQNPDKDGYATVKLCNNGKERKFKIHRLIALYYLEKIEGKDFVDHINRNKKDNSIENLRWVNKKENCLNRSTYKNCKLKQKKRTLLKEK